jgi:hypothetical protein
VPLEINPDWEKTKGSGKAKPRKQVDQMFADVSTFPYIEATVIVYGFDLFLIILYILTGKKAVVDDACDAF